MIPARAGVRILTVVGTRPQLIKAAALGPALRARHEEIFVDTGQHWDDDLAGVFFEELGLPRPDVSLGVGGGTASEQVGRMLLGLDAVLAEIRPDAVLVYGDTNSTLAGALAAAQRGLPLAHVEAGLRSFDRSMPEEVNRVVTDHLARWCFAPTETAVANLVAEGIREGVVLVGDVLQDLAARTSREVRRPAVLAEIGQRLLGDAAALAPGGYLFATVHRAANRSPEALRTWLGLLGRLGRPERPVVLPLHPGTRAAIEAAGCSIPDTVRVVPPVGYRTSLALQLHAAAVLTDSGGVQREAAWLGVPCLVLRETTEWREAVEGSAGRLVVVGLDAARAAGELERLAPVGRASVAAEERAAGLDLRPAGAAEAIAQVLATAEV